MPSPIATNPGYFVRVSISAHPKNDCSPKNKPLAGAKQLTRNLDGDSPASSQRTGVRRNRGSRCRLPSRRFGEGRFALLLSHQGAPPKEELAVIAEGTLTAFRLGTLA